MPSVLLVLLMLLVLLVLSVLSVLSGFFDFVPVVVGLVVETLVEVPFVVEAVVVVEDFECVFEVVDVSGA